MRTQVVATGVLIVALMGRLAAAQVFGAVPAQGGSFAPPPPPQTAPAPPPPTSGAGLHPLSGLPVPLPDVATPIRPDPFRPTLGNAPAPPLTTRGPVDLYRATPGTYERITPPWLNPYWVAGGYAIAPYDAREERDRSAARRQAPAPRSGYLVFRVQPATSEVYVDGYYLGTVADLAAGRALPEGGHRLELRATGFDTMTMDVRIMAGETITINRLLTRTTTAPPPALAQAAPPTAARPFYVIRGCYAGSTHPKDVKLPAGCDVRNVRVVPAVVNEVARRRS